MLFTLLLLLFTKKLDFFSINNFKANSRRSMERIETELYIPAYSDDLLTITYVICFPVSTNNL